MAPKVANLLESLEIPHKPPTYGINSMTIKIGEFGKHPQLLQVSDQVKKQESANSTPYGFQSEWSLPTLKSVQST